MKQSSPPQAAVAPQVRSGKYTNIVSVLRANPGVPYEVTDDLPTFADNDKARQFARIVVRGGRKDFEPAGAFSAWVQGVQVWMQYDTPSADESTSTAQDAPSTDDDDADDAPEF